MKLSITKSIIFGIIFACVYLFAFTSKVEANSPAVTGSILTSVTNAPIPNVWVKWTDGWGNIRYTQADGSGNFNFPSWQNSYGWDSQAQMDTRQIMTQTKININLDGTNCAALSNFDFLVAVGQGSCAYQAYHPSTDWGSGFGCDQEPNIFTAIKPYNSYGSFEVITLPDVLRPGVNNSLATQDIGPIYFTSSPSPTPTPLGSPNIISLQAKNALAPTPSFTGTFGRSGNQQVQNGSDWLNPMLIRLNVTPGSAGNVKFYATAFYDQKQGQSSNQPALTSLAAIESQIDADASRGFILGYASAACANTNTDCPVDGKGPNVPYTFQAGRYYAYIRGNGWIDITNYPSGFYINNNTGTRILAIYPHSNGTYYGQWKVLYYTAFTSKNMYTAGYAVDGNNLSNFRSDISPTALP